MSNWWVSAIITSNIYNWSMQCTVDTNKSKDLYSHLNCTIEFRFTIY